MLSARSLAALGCVVTLAVAAGVLLALTAFGTLQYAAVVAMKPPTPTPDPATLPPKLVVSPVGTGYTAAESLHEARQIDDARGPGGRDVIQGMIDSGRALTILWPAFLMAGVLEMLVFVVVDPADLHWFGGEALNWSAQAVYTVTFSKFQDDGLLEVKQRHIRILDEAGLRQLITSTAC
jgi:hypothetical protein